MNLFKVKEMLKTVQITKFLKEIVNWQKKLFLVIFKCFLNKILKKSSGFPTHLIFIKKYFSLLPHPPFIHITNMSRFLPSHPSIKNKYDLNSFIINKNCHSVDEKRKKTYPINSKNVICIESDILSAATAEPILNFLFWRLHDSRVA